MPPEQNLGQLSIGLVGDVRRLISDLDGIIRRFQDMSRVGESAQQRLTNAIEGLTREILQLRSASAQTATEQDPLQRALRETAREAANAGAQADRAARQIRELSGATAALGPESVNFRNMGAATRQWAKEMTEIDPILGRFVRNQERFFSNFGQQVADFARRSQIVSADFRGLGVATREWANAAFQADPVLERFVKKQGRYFANFGREISEFARLSQPGAANFRVLGEGTAEWARAMQAADPVLQKFIRNQQRFFSGFGAAVSDFARRSSPAAADFRNIGVATGEWAKQAQAADPILKRFYQRAPFLDFGGKAIADAARAATAGVESVRQFGNETRGLLQIPTGGGFFNKMFGNFIPGVGQAIAVLARFGTASAAVAGTLAGIGAEVRAFTTFDDSMAQLGAITRASADDMVLLAEAAREVGRTSILGATEAVRALTLLGQAGFTAREAIQALDATVALAVGGVSSLEASTQILTSTIRAFSLDAGEANRVANVLAATVNQSKSSIEGLNVAFNFAGAAASAAGLEVEDLAAILGVLADRGIQFSTQGTAVRQIVTALIEPTTRAQKVFAQLGISLDEIDPRGKDIVEVLELLRQKGFGVAEAMRAFDLRIASTISTAIRAVGSIRTMRDNVSGTTDAFTALERRQESFTSKLLILGNQMKDIGISIGNTVGPAFLKLLELMTKLVDVASKLGPVIVGIGGAFLALRAPAAALGLLNAALSGLLTASFSVQAILGGLPFVALAGAIALATKAYVDLTAKSKEFAEQQKEQRDAVIATTKSGADIIRNFENTLTELQGLKQGTVDYDTALRDLDRATLVLTTRFPELSGKLTTVAERTEFAAGKLAEYRREAQLGPILDQLRKKQEELRKELEKPIVDPLSKILLEGFTTTKVEELETEIHNLKEALRGLSQESREVDAAFRTVTEPLKALQEALRTGNQEAQEAARDGVIRAIEDIAIATFNLDPASEKAQEFFKTIRNAAAGAALDAVAFRIALENIGTAEIDEENINRIIELIARLRSVLNAPVQTLDQPKGESDGDRKARLREQAEVIRLQAQIAAERAKRAGDLVRAAQLTAEAERKAIILEHDGVIEALKLEQLALQELTDIEKARAEEADRRIRQRLAEFPELIQDLDQERQQALSLLDIDRQRAEAGRLPGGVADNIANNRRAQLTTEQRFNQRAIELRRKIVDELEKEEATGQRLNIDQKKQLADNKREIADLEHQNQLLEQQVDLIREAGTVAIDVGEILKTTIADALEGAILGTQKLSDSLKAAGLSLGKSILQSFTQSLVEKAKFDKVFEVNFAELAAGAFKALTEGEDGTGGIVGAFESALGALQSFTGQAEEGLGGVAETAAGVAEEVAGMTSAFEEATVGVPTSSSGIAPNAGAPGTTGALAGGGSSLFGSVGLLGTLVAAVGAVVAIANAAKSLTEQTDKLEKTTRGVGSTRRNAGILGASTIATLTATGAAVGATAGAAAFGIGAIPGALIGGAIGATIATQLNKALTEELNDTISKALKEGISQREVDRRVAKNPLLNVVAGGVPAANEAGLPATGIVHAFAAGFGGPLGLVLSLVMEKLITGLSPNIEAIFDTMFTDMAKDLGFNFNRFFREGIGSGLGGENKRAAQQFFGRAKGDRPEGELRGEAQTIAQIFAGLTGAGIFNEERVQRFFSILANNLVLTRKSATELDSAMLNLLQKALGTNLVDGIFNLRRAFGVTKREFKEFANEQAVMGRQLRDFAKAFDVATRALGQGLGRSKDNAAALLKILGQGNFQGQKGRKQSREVVLGASNQLLSAGELFEGPNFEENFGNFVNQLRDGVREAMHQGIVESLVKSTGVSLLLADFFNNIAKLSKRAFARGITPELKLDIRDTVDRAGDRLKKALELYKPVLAEIGELASEIDERLKEALETPEARKEEQERLQTERQGLIGQIVEKLRQAVLSVGVAVRSFTQSSARLAQKIFATSGAEGVAPEVPDILREGIKRVRAETQKVLDEGDGITTEGRLQSLGNLEDAIDEWLDSALTFTKEMFEPAIEQAKQFADAAKQAAANLLAFRTRDGAPGSPNDKLNLIREEIAKQQAILLSGDPEKQLEAGQRLQELFGDLLAVGEEQLDTTGPQFKALNREVDTGLQQVKDVFEANGFVLEGLQKQMDEKLQAIRDDARVQYEFVQKHTLPLEEQQIKEAESRRDQTLAIIAALTGSDVNSVKSAIEALLGADTKTLTDIVTAITNMEFGEDIGTPPPPPPPPGEDPGTRPPGETDRGEPTERLSDRARKFFREANIPEAGIHAAKVWDALKQTIDRLRTALKSQVAPKFKDLIPGIMDAFQSNADLLRINYPQILQAADVADITQFFRELVLGQNIDGFSPKDFTDRFYSSLRNVLGLRTGGILTGAQGLLAHHEKGIREAVIPLDNRGLRFMEEMIERMHAPISTEGQPIEVVFGPGAIQVVAPPGTSSDQLQGLSRQLLADLDQQFRVGRLRKTIQEVVRTTR